MKVSFLVCVMLTFIIARDSLSVFRGLIIIGHNSVVLPCSPTNICPITSEAGLLKWSITVMKQ